jgi:hypothetical protein
LGVCADQFRTLLGELRLYRQRQQTAPHHESGDQLISLASKLHLIPLSLDLRAGKALRGFIVADADGPN